MSFARATRYAGPLLLVVLVAGAWWVRTRPIPEQGAYVGSAACAVCHGAIHGSWKASQHTKMMRPVSAPGVVVANFQTDDPGLRFERSDAVWAIGGKWEQQFMGRDAHGETLLPGAWLKLAGHWDFQGWDGWQAPVPLHRCHGCHTVGLDVKAGTFVEPNIGCESCHGPGSWHVRTLGLGAIYTSVDAQVCGQCHTRGTSPDGENSFPVGYRPGRELQAFFDFNEPVPGQNSSYWWGDGRERQRHQEYPAWQRGGHADSLRSLRQGYDGRYGEVTRDCLRCHAGDVAVATGPAPGVADARYGITCTVCHNVHGDLDELRLGCQACHVTGAFYHEPERNAHHVPCPPQAKVGCVDCHMPESISIGGAFALREHSPGIIPPSDTIAWGTPSSCANGGCHADKAPEALQALFTAYYGAVAQPGELSGAERPPTRPSAAVPVGTAVAGLR